MEMFVDWALVFLAVGAGMYHLGVWRGKVAAIAVSDAALRVQSLRLAEMERDVQGVALALMELRDAVGPTS